MLLCLISAFLVASIWSLMSLLACSKCAEAIVWSFCSFSYLSIHMSLVSFSPLMISLRLLIFSLSCFLVSSNYLSILYFLMSRASICLSCSTMRLSSSSISFCFLWRVSSFCLSTSYSPLAFSNSSPSLISVSWRTLLVMWSLATVSLRSLFVVSSCS